MTPHSMLMKLTIAATNLQGQYQVDQAQVPLAKEFYADNEMAPKNAHLMPLSATGPISAGIVEELIHNRNALRRARIEAI